MTLHQEYIYLTNILKSERERENVSTECYLLHWIDDSFEVKGAAIEASPSLTTWTWSSSSSRRTWLILSCTEITQQNILDLKNLREAVWSKVNIISITTSVTFNYSSKSKLQRGKCVWPQHTHTHTHTHLCTCHTCALTTHTQTDTCTHLLSGKLLLPLGHDPVPGSARADLGSRAQHGWQGPGVIGQSLLLLSPFLPLGHALRGVSQQGHACQNKVGLMKVPTFP